jgi:putative SOS response-associated peptidase YedK
MCGRFSIAVRIGYLTERFGIPEPPDISLPIYNIAPGEIVPVIFQSREFSNQGETKVDLMRWGLIPGWTKEDQPAITPINARIEGIDKKDLFRNLLHNGRCIVPASGFYEWEKPGKTRFPWYIRLKEQQIFGMAGLFDTRKRPDGTITRSFTIITTRANSLVAPLHNRMPAIIMRGDEKKWLDPAYDVNTALALVPDPYPEEAMELFRVTVSVNTPSFKSESAVKKEAPPDFSLEKWNPS